MSQVSMAMKELAYEQSVALLVSKLYFDAIRRLICIIVQQQCGG